MRLGGARGPFQRAVSGQFMAFFPQAIKNLDIRFFFFKKNKNKNKNKKIPKMTN